MGATDSHMPRTIRESALELCRLAERHQQLLESAERGGDMDFTHEMCASLECSCRRVLRDTLTETIHVLDETRRSFKSKQLAELRKKLIATLAQWG
jgi:hypothetical protein